MDLQFQVAGHPGGISLLDGGTRIVKLTSKYEADFYEQVQKAASAETGTTGPFTRLLALMPSYHGSQPASEEPNGSDKQNTAVAIENLTHGFVHPNVLDIKLGSQLWDERATVEKRDRMDAAARSTTSWTDGIRLTGWQVWDNAAQCAIPTSKAFGKTIVTEMLPTGVRLFFGCANNDDWNEFMTIVTAAGEEAPAQAPVALPHLHVAELLKSFILPQLKLAADLASHLEVRMRGGSLLVVYEGDSNTLASRLSTWTASGSAIPVANVKLIDFAHARLAQGEGPDEGVLKGLQTVVSLVEDLLQRL
ncbi:SAICAR synthase-like protein [Tilletiaria anomala UBC 951]|uniref:Kinase n=1 Tax=Tilletiaria anomala (strain ATCC 24038 / CBS 436.72 / UBC 951) TaxID=1037660 RepID=A0A066W5A3_TILAU|nr:SAICAR synthase-like protein [Tilletiaria anomala UBC 951]KDN48891.1 SAICAR synthase-like protein [Tilletiaria anomala UBC 951]